MASIPFRIQPANQYLLHIVLVGIGIGTANYLMNDMLNWLQWTIQSVSTSFFIGYTLVVIGVNKSWFRSYFRTRIGLYLFLFGAFFLAGVLATEIEHIIRALVFKNEQFQLFSSGKMYGFNGIISLILGVSFLSNDLLRKTDTLAQPSKENIQTHKNKEEGFDLITHVPVKEGETILLTPIEDIAYFEAYDNYAFVYVVGGKKKLCDYSLRFLENRLPKSFSRIHRKYIVNEKHIKQIKPHINGRYHILFDKGLEPISSSKGYTTVIRNLIKIE